MSKVFACEIASLELATIVLEMSKKNLFSKIDGGCAFSNRFDSEEMMVAGDSDSYIITVKFKEPAGEAGPVFSSSWISAIKVVESSRCCAGVS